MPPRDAHDALIALLRMAYSAEKAAAYAYRGHAASVSDPDERAAIRKIEDEEWRHRELVGGILRDLGVEPSPGRERRAAVIGRVLAVLCHLTGWLAPMYGAGKLERKNIGEYEDAARFAVACGRAEFVDCLLEMAEVEWEHERYFRGRVLTHRFAPWIPLWPPTPPKSAIREAFGAEGSAARSG